MDELPPIKNPYLIVSGIKCYLDKKGHHYVDRLWYKDLAEHCRYLKNLTLAAPVEYRENFENLICLEEDPVCSRIHFCDLPDPSSFLKSLLLLPKTISKLWKAIGQSEIAHSGVANWPIPYGWIVNPIARLRKKYQVIVIESAFWNIPPGIKVSWKFKVRSYITERLNRWCVNSADLPIFTEESYRANLLTDPKKKGYVIHASWIDEKNILSEITAAQLWNKKRGEKNLKVLFAGQLNVNKGLLVLIEALKTLAKEKLEIEIDVLGEGELLLKCQEAVIQLQGPTKLNLLGTLPYGEEFFHLLQRYHALIVPSLTNEQPRIVYDAYSQALPVLAAKTSGLIECVFDGQTGRLFEINNPSALADALKWSLSNIPKLEILGINGRKQAGSMTHQKMHRERWKLLLKMLK